MGPDTAEEAEQPAPRLVLVATATSIAAALVVLVVYVARALVLVRYPWDWSPDEGLFLDYARRALEAPETLYPHRVVPLPSFYGPLLPFLMAPLVKLKAPLAAARLMELALTLAGAAAVAQLVRRGTGALWALCGLALYLAPLNLSFWNMLVRVDGAMLALFLWAAVFLLPREITRGADVLGARRLLVGGALLMAATLVKPTVAFHGAPLVLGWFLVDRRSAWRLTGAMAAAGLASFGVLQVATHGGFLWVNRLWALHSKEPNLATNILIYFVGLSWPILVLAATAGVVAWRARATPLREPALLLVAGGLAIVPLLQKHGASWNYMLPLFAALVVTTCRWFGRAGAGGETPRPRSPPRPAAIVAVSIVSLLLVATRRFPLPSAADAATAHVFYRLVLGAQRQLGGPLLLARPDLAYFLAGQSEEVEGSSFQDLVEGAAPGVEQVFDGLKARRYSVVVETWPLTERPEWRQALREGYRHIAGCSLAWYFGVNLMSNVLVRRGQPMVFIPPEGVRCFAAYPESQAGPDEDRPEGASPEPAAGR
jgi:hypothetical protein